jgi:predicted membrane protein
LNISNTPPDSIAPSAEAGTPKPRGLAGLDRRTAWLRATLLTACLFGLVISYPVWLTTRAVPLLPISKSFPILPSPLDKFLFDAMLLALVLAFRFFRRGVIFFLVTSFFAYCEDQNRGQPWLYMYWVMLLFTLFPEPAAIAACRLAISVAYVWGGLQKLQPAFFNRVPDWFVAPAATRWHWPGELVEVLRFGIACAPLFELFIGICLWVPRFRKAAIAAALLVHLAALVFLGPAGYNYNQVIWPWNAAMMALVLVLFAETIRSPRRATAVSAATESESLLSLAGNLAALRRSRPALIILALYSVLPLLSYVGYWDSYFSFTLYAENQAKADIFVTEAFANRLPPAMRAHVHKLRQAYNEQLQGPFVFDFQAWAFRELHVPPLLDHHLGRYARDPNELRMIVSPRYGPAVFYQGNIHLVIPSK